MTVSIVLAAHDAGRSIARCLEALSRQAGIERAEVGWAREAEIFSVARKNRHVEDGLCMHLFHSPGDLKHLFH